MAQWAKALAVRPGDLSSVWQTHRGGKREVIPTSCAHTSTCMPPHPHITKEQRIKTKVIKQRSNQVRHQSQLLIPTCIHTYLESTHTRRVQGVSFSMTVLPRLSKAEFDSTTTFTKRCVCRYISRGNFYTW